MTQTHCNMTNHKGTHLSYEERVQIKTLIDLGFSNRAIARELQRAPQTINNEVNRGKTRQIHRQKPKDKVYEYEAFVYVPSLAEEKYRQNRKRCGARPLWTKNTDFIPWADELMLKHRWSPEAVIMQAHRENCFDQRPIPCVTTLYAWIDKRLMKTRNIDLLEKLTRQPTSKSFKHHINQRILGPSIETRPKDIYKRQEFGHWEIDTVIGTKDKTKPVILTLVERQTRFEILELIDAKSADAVTHALTKLFDQLGDKTPHIFKSITSDNGSEFASLFETFSPMIDIYFTHPFSSFERGTSENQHKLIRRYLPKGYDLSLITSEYVKTIQQFMNDYPRKSLEHNTAHHRMAKELKRLGIL